MSFENKSKKQQVTTRSISFRLIFNSLRYFDTFVKVDTTKSSMYCNANTGLEACFEPSQLPSCQIERLSANWATFSSHCVMLMFGLVFETPATTVCLKHLSC